MKSLSARPIVLVTDFGPGSAYVGQMRLAIHRLAPQVTVLDLAHDLPPQNRAAAALVLEGARAYLPDGAIVVVVVDPGVGTTRRILAARYANGLVVVVPDNGILSGASGFDSPVELRVVKNEALFLRPVSPVFHGRDIFAPVAARLATGLALKGVGPLVRYESLVAAPWPCPAVRRSVHGVCVIGADGFGNLITNLRAEALGTRRILSVRCGGRRFPLVTHYQAVKKGARLALMGSHGRLELAVREASAAAVLRILPGREVTVKLG